MPIRPHILTPCTADAKPRLKSRAAYWQQPSETSVARRVPATAGSGQIQQFKRADSQALAGQAHLGRAVHKGVCGSKGAQHGRLGDGALHGGLGQQQQLALAQGGHPAPGAQQLQQVPQPASGAGRSHQDAIKLAPCSGSPVSDRVVQQAGSELGCGLDWGSLDAELASRDPTSHFELLHQVV